MQNDPSSTVGDSKSSPQRRLDLPSIAIWLVAGALIAVLWTRLFQTLPPGHALGLSLLHLMIAGSIGLVVALLLRAVQRYFRRSAPKAE